MTRVRETRAAPSAVAQAPQLAPPAPPVKRRAKARTPVANPVKTKAAAAELATPPAPESPFFKAYIRFLSLAAEHAQAQPEPDLDPNEKALLELMIVHWSSGQPWTVRQAIAQTQLGSPATLHKRLTRLRKKNYCLLRDSLEDRRIKFLTPGPKGLAYIEAMGHQLLSARRSAKRAGD